jgi:hypothetical protein
MENIEERFHNFVDEWEQDTCFESSTTIRMTHPVYQEIINLGEEAIPLILKEMEENGGHWFHALEMLTGEDPTNPEDAGRVAKLQESWLEWGRKRGYFD